MMPWRHIPFAYAVGAGLGVVPRHLREQAEFGAPRASSDIDARSGSDRWTFQN